jgi:hypothetical protein
MHASATVRVELLQHVHLGKLHKFSVITDQPPAYVHCIGATIQCVAASIRQYIYITQHARRRRFDKPVQRRDNVNGQDSPCLLVQNLLVITLRKVKHKKDLCAKNLGLIWSWHALAHTHAGDRWRQMRERV